MPALFRLTPTLIDKKLAKKPGRHADGGGLYLQVSPTHTRSWLYQFKLGSRTRQLGLGSAEIVSLALARKLAGDARELVAQGLDPIDLKREARKAAAVTVAAPLTFKQMAGIFITDNAPSWRNPVHRAQWPASLEAYVYPVIGTLPIKEVTTAHILKILRPIWHEKPETAGRIRARIERILSAAKADGHRDGENPARWKDHLEHSLPSQSKLSVRHHPAMPYADMPAFMAELQRHPGISPRALEMLILTAARTSEITGLVDSELDLENALWTIPGERMKTGREHIVPLCSRAVEILRSIPREKGNPYLFAGKKAGTSISNMTMLQLLRGMRDGLTVHGFRSTFTDWASEQTSASHAAIEMSLAHTIANKVEAAYRRGNLLDKRRALMTEWQNFLYPAEATP